MKENSVFGDLFEQFDMDGHGFSLNETVLPSVQKKILDTYGPADEEDMFTHSRYEGEENYVKFLLLNDGTPIHVIDDHVDVIHWSGVGYDSTYNSGVISVASEPDGELNVYARKQPTKEQVGWLLWLAREHGSKRMVVSLGGLGGDNIVGKIRSSEDLKKALSGKPISEPSLAAQFHENVDEATASQIRRKQKSINKLFPQFPERVKAIQDKGGLRLKRVDQETWKWKIHSGTKKDVWYDAVVHFKNVEPLLRKLVADRRLWNKDKTKVNLNKLSREFLKRADIQLECSCPAQKYWGGDYILSKPKYDAKYGDPENRAPNIRNPKQYGAHCKHLQNLFKALPFYADTVAKWLDDFYPDMIGEVEKQAGAEADKFKRAGEELSKRKVAKEKPVRKPVRPAKAEEEPREAEPRKEPERKPEREEEPQKEEPERKVEPEMEEPEREEEPQKEEERPAKAQKAKKEPEEEDLPDQVEEPEESEEDEDEDEKDNRKIWT